MTSNALINWICPFITTGIHLNRDKGTRRINLLSDCLKVDSFLSTKLSDTDKNTNDNDNSTVPSVKKFAQGQEKETKSITYNSYGNVNGLAGISKEYTGRDKFIGKRKEDLGDAVFLCERQQKLCHLSEQEMSVGLHIILTGHDLSYYRMSITSEDNYGNKIENMKKWFYSN